MNASVSTSHLGSFSQLTKTHLWKKISIIGLVFCVYWLAFPSLIATWGHPYRFLAMSYIILAAVFWGIKGGVAVALFNIPIAYAILTLMDLEYFAGVIGSAFAIIIAFIIGCLTDLSRKLEEAIKLKERAEQGLKEHQNELEALVTERTSELVKTNHLLQNEIAGRQKSEKELKQNEEKYRLLLENQTDLIVKYDQNGRFLFVNPSFCQMFGKSEKELLGEKFEPNVNAGDPQSREKAIQNLDQPPYSTYVEQLTETANGWRWLGWMHTAVLDDNKTPVAIIGVGRDITAQKKTEEEKQILESRLVQSQKMEAIGTLAAGIAHDFNNILSPIIGYTEILKMNLEGNKEGHPELDRVLKASHRAKDLVNQILAFGRQSEPELKPLRVDAIAKETLKFARATLPTTIDISQSIHTSSLINGDPTQIHQVLMNLVTNAGHAMQEKGGSLAMELNDVELDYRFIATHPDLQEGWHLKLSVSDTGYGMTPEIQARIFEPFFTTKRKGEGTGMGLSVVHGIMKNHGGAIYVYSEPDKGTRFTLFFPIIENEAQIETEKITPTPKGSEHILFIDDEPTIVDMGRQWLESLGYTVTTRISSTEALMLFKARSERFDLVITDMTMPEITGDQLAKELISIKPSIPIILCTGFSERMTEIKAKSIGIKEYVMKPMLIKDLAETVRKVLDHNSFSDNS